RPFNEAWSEAARTVYDGILVAKNKLNHEPFTRGLLASNRDPQGAEELVGATAHCGDEEFNGYEVMQRTPLLVRWMAIGSLSLLLSLTVTEDKSYRRQEF